MIIFNMFKLFFCDVFRWYRERPVVRNELGDLREDYHFANCVNILDLRNYWKLKSQVIPWFLTCCKQAEFLFLYTRRSLQLCILISINRVVNVHSDESSCETKQKSRAFPQMCWYFRMNTALPIFFERVFFSFWRSSCLYLIHCFSSLYSKETFH